MPYIGGFPIYVDKCNRIMMGGYEGFVTAGSEKPTAPPQVRCTERWHVELDMEVISPAAIAAKQVPIV